MHAKSITVTFLVIICSMSVFAFPAILSDQGTGVTLSGTTVSSGDLQITIWSDPTSMDPSNLVFNQTYVGAIQNGAWNVQLNDSVLNLDFGAKYWKDYKINGQDLDFSGQERLAFYSSVGAIDNTTNSIAIGTWRTESTNDSSIAIGDAARATGASAISIGYGRSSGYASVALGEGSSATNDSSIAIGYADSRGTYGIAIGKSAMATLYGGVALGTNTYAREFSTALGAHANAVGNRTIALGYYAESDNESSVAIGDTAQAPNRSSTAIGNHATARGTSTIAVGSGSLAQGIDANAIGNNAQAVYNDALALGSSAYASDFAATALGAYSFATNESTIALGRQTLASGYRSVAIGGYALASKPYTMALGYLANTSFTNSVALGSYATTTADNQLVIGNITSAYNLNTQIFGTLNAAGAITQNDVLVCLQDGTNCPGALNTYHSSAAGWVNTTTKISTNLSLNVSDAFFVNGTGSMNPGSGTTVYGIGMLPSVNTTGGSFPTGVLVSPYVESEVNSITGVNIRPDIAPRTTVDVVYGTNNIPLIQNSSAGAFNITSMDGLLARIDTKSGWYANITYAKTISISSPTIGDGSRMENVYGLFISDMIGGSVSNYGIYSAGTTNLNYFGGNVGIGTPTPATTLDVGGYILASGVNPRIYIGNGSNPLTNPVYAIDNNRNIFRVIYASDITAPGTGVFVINGSNGNVGIGVSSPTQKFEVAGNVNITGSASIGAVLVLPPQPDYPSSPIIGTVFMNITNVPCYYNGTLWKTFAGGSC